MIGINLSEVKGSFDASTILWPTDQYVKKLLHKFGGYVRKTQRNSLKKAKPGVRGGRQRSQVGQPPLRHSENPDIKNTVFYYADPKTKQVVIGMVLLKGKKTAGEPMPGVLEYGGRSVVVSRRGVVAGDKRKTAILRTIEVKPRPSAVPAFEKGIKHYLPELIAEGINQYAKGGVQGRIGP